jgi:hypothetical protein
MALIGKQFEGMDPRFAPYAADSLLDTPRFTGASGFDFARFRISHMTIASAGNRIAMSN